MLRSTATVGGATIASRILGFLRDVVLARWFGASGETDAFFLAFKIPNFMRRLFAEGSFSLAFVPVLSELREQGDRRQLKRFIDNVTGALASFLVVLTAIGVLAAPLVLGLFAPGWWLEGRPEFALSADMLRITFPYILLVSLVALAGGILNSFERFLVPALTPILLNLSLIGCAVFLSGHLAVPVMALAWGVLLAGVLQLLFQVPALMRLGLLPRPRWGWGQPGVTRVLKLMVPTLIGSSAAQVNLLIDSVIATFLVTGSVSWLYYSDRLLEFPLGVFGVALATVILPNLSRKHAARSAEAFSDTLDWALRLAMLITLPAAVGLVVLAGPILSTLFQYGAFSAEDVGMARISLVAYSVGLPAFIAVKVLAPGFYARQDTRTPVRYSLLSMGVNVVLNLAFVGGLLWWGFVGPHAGLAAASSASAVLNASLLFRGLRRAGVYTPVPGWTRVLLGVVLACAAMVAVLAWLAPPVDSWATLKAPARAGQLAWVILAGAAAYGLAALACGLRPGHFSRGSH
nr:murein biosynthesis integral membrane protein MurJ [Marinihelvus fidelis]